MCSAAAVAENTHINMEVPTDIVSSDWRIDFLSGIEQPAVAMEIRVPSYRSKRQYRTWNGINDECDRVL
jgi:hypothetical protein